MYKKEVLRAECKKKQKKKIWIFSASAPPPPHICNIFQENQSSRPLFKARSSKNALRTSFWWMFTLYAVRYSYARINFKPPLCQYFPNAHSRVFTCINS